MRTTYLKNAILAASLTGATAIFSGTAFAQAAGYPNMHADDISSQQSAPQQSMQQGGLTRSEVKQDLARVEATGYRPASDNTQYPAGIQAAESQVQAQQTPANYSSNYLVYPAAAPQQN